MRRSAVAKGNSSTSSPRMPGMLGPRMSASTRPTRLPLWDSAIARLTATVDLPTPPLPLATATILRIPGSLFPDGSGADAVGFSVNEIDCGATSGFDGAASGFDGAASRCAAAGSSDGVIVGVAAWLAALADLRAIRRR